MGEKRERVYVCVFRKRYYKKDMEKEVLEMASASTGRDHQSCIQHYVL